MAGVHLTNAGIPYTTNAPCWISCSSLSLSFMRRWKSVEGMAREESNCARQLLATRPARPHAHHAPGSMTGRDLSFTLSTCFSAARPGECSSASTALCCAAMFAIASGSCAMVSMEHTMCNGGYACVCEGFGHRESARAEPRGGASLETAPGDLTWLPPG